MTLITGIRFNDHAGAMACDEERTTADGKRRILTSDKVECMVPPRITREQRLCGAFGHSGSSALGTELNLEIFADLENRYEEAIRKHGKKPDRFMSVEELVDLLYDVYVRVKHRHMDDLLRHRFGFDTKAYIQGFSVAADGRKTQLKDADILKKAGAYITHGEKIHETDKIFFNRAVVVGYAPSSGLQIYRLSACEAMLEPVNALYFTHGSGRDGTETVFAPYIQRMNQSQRRGNLDPVEGMAMLCAASANSIATNIGVGGYPNLTLIDGEAKDPDRIYRTVGDVRSKLASEISCAWSDGFLPRKQAFDLVGELLFGDGDFDAVERRLWTVAPDPKRLRAYLRGHVL